MQPRPAALDAMQDEARVALAAWELDAGAWRITSYVPGMQGAILRPIIAISQEGNPDRPNAPRYLLRRQTPDLTEDDLHFRQAFMRHLADAGLPVPTPLPRPDGHTYAILAEDAANGVYELQRWLPGQPFETEGPTASAGLSEAARTLGMLHQASAEFSWGQHHWPAERAPLALAQTYTDLIHAAADESSLGQPVCDGLLRLADACDERCELAAVALSPRFPALHIHGDYQPHHLAFAPDASGQVTAIVDFDAAHWEQRLIELAYSLLFFTGVRWERPEGEKFQPTGVTPPLVDDGLDVVRAHSFLAAYGQEAPPDVGEADALADALALVFPIVFANGAGEDMVFHADYEGELDEEDALARLAWADRFWLWLDRYRGTLAEVWAGA